MPIQPGTVIQELLDKYRSRQENISFFVGAGLSMPLFPSWKDLLRELLNLCGEKRNLGFDHNDLDARISNGDNSLELANYFRKALPDASYYDLLDRLFDKEFGKDDIPKAYEALLNLSPQLLVTTNYDNIPNACLGNTHTIVTHDQISELNRRLQKGKPCVLKLHGDIDNQKTMILTSEDYSNIIHKNLETNAFMKSYFTNYTVLFLGFSLTDPHILLYLDFLKGIQITAGITHYALLPNVTPFDCHILEDRYNVKVIPYKPADPSHPEVWELIRCFQAVADGKEPEALTAGYTEKDVTRYREFSPRGIIKQGDQRSDRIQDYKRCLEEAEKDCFISGTSMIHLLEDSRALLENKLEEGHVIRLLMMDPEWAKDNHKLFTFRDEEDRRVFYKEVDMGLDKARSIKRKHPALQIRIYRTVFPYIVTGYQAGSSGKMVVEITDYLQEENRPRFTLHDLDSDSTLFKQVKGKFFSLWSNDKICEEVAL